MRHRRHLRLAVMSPAALSRLISPSALLVVGLVLLGFSITHERFQGLSAAASLRRSACPTPFRLTVHEGLLSLRAQDASLKAIIEEIGRQLSIETAAHLSSEQCVTVAFEHLSIAEAIEVLGNHVTMIALERPSGGARGQITKILAFPKDPDLGHSTSAPHPSDIAATADTTYYLSPSGSDARAGTSPRAPWRTFRHAIPRLKAGDTLMLMDGTYRGSNSGYPHINCDGSANHGTASNPITLKAQHERRAFLKGDGSAAPFLIQNCSYWSVQGLRAENGDFSGQSGGTVFTVRASDHIALRRNLGAKNNRYTNSDIFLVRSSTYILLEENEAYSFHRHGISVSQSALITLRRNYVNSRGYADISGGRPSHSGAQNRGDEGITFYSGNDSIAENNIDEGNEMFATHGQRNLFVGNVTLGSLWGFLVGHHCCNSEPVRDHRLINNASISSGGPNYLEQSTVNTLVDQLTAYGSRTSHGAAGNNKFSSQHGSYAWTVHPSTTIRNSLFLNNRATGLRILHAEDYAFRVLEYLNAFGNAAGNYSLGTETRTHATSIDPHMGACRVFLPDNSPMKGAGKHGTDIGANILYVYENGQLTTKPLWRPGSGHFPCGARVPGLNDLPGRSCVDVHTRLNVHTNGCALPSGYAGAWPPTPGPLPTK